MPRSKNPNPSQVHSLLEDSSLRDQDVDDDLNGPTSESFSPPEIDISDAELEPESFPTLSTVDGAPSTHDISSAADREHNSGAANNLNQNQGLRSASASVGGRISGSSFVPIQQNDKEAVDEVQGDEDDEDASLSPKIESTTTLAHDPSRPTMVAYPTPGYKSEKSSALESFYAPSVPSLMSWFRRRFTMKEGAHTSASQVIKLYDEDFKGQGFVSLHNFQVGQYLRRLFPGLQRRKITKNGKRSWVYRDLCVVRDGENTIPAGTVSNGSGSSEADVRRSARVRRVKSFDRDYDCSTDEKPERRGMKRKVQHDGILYKLLFPPPLPNKPGPNSKDNSSARLKTAREENILQWLHENYEYADNSHVRSLDVLRRYNSGRHSWVQHLSQVGRFIKYAFPRAKHSRRTMKGGKREWVYQNIRPKTDKSRSTTVAPPTSTSLRAPGSRRNSSKPLKCSTSSTFIELTRDDNDDRDGDSDSSLTKIDLSGTSLPVLPAELARIYQRESTTLPDSDAKRRKTSGVADQKPLIYRKADGDEMSTSKVFGASCAQTNSAPQRKSFLESHINRLHETKTRQARSLTASPNLPSDQKTDNGDFKRAVADSSVLSSLEALCTDIDVTDGDRTGNGVAGIDCDGIGTFGYFRNQHPKESNDGQFDADSTHHRKDGGTSNLEELMDNVKREVKGQCGEDRFAPRPEAAMGVVPVANSPHSGSLRADWKTLKSYATHPSGWVATPTKHVTDQRNFAEWILFEDDALCNGHRVIRELRIYDDWSVSIHVMGVKVHPEEVGGITNLGRTWSDINKYHYIRDEGSTNAIFDDLAVACKSLRNPDLHTNEETFVYVMQSWHPQVFTTLANAKVCRGSPSPCLSDIRTRGVVVAKSEIWSARNQESEELRHRAINCQVLHHRENNCCERCLRVMMVQKEMAEPAANDKYSSRVTFK